MQKRYHLFFSGNVQGVGFRYMARDLAAKYSINGWVANLIDGRVELDIEGINSDLDNFMKDLAKEFKSYIIGVEKEEILSLNKDTGFHIKFLD